MSWFNASQLSSFAKQALSQAQKSIDRVLDIQAEESPWPDAVIPDYGDGEEENYHLSWTADNVYCQLQAVAWRVRKNMKPVTD